MSEEENRDYDVQYESEDEEEHLALIVEDEKVNQIHISKALKKRGFTCSIAPTVKRAVECIEEAIENKQSFEVIFLDIILEDNSNANGVDLLKLIRENNWMEQALIIVMSGTEELVMVKECHKYKIQNYIRKPLTETNLENEIIKINNHIKGLKCPIPGYKKEKMIGAGASGEVYLVRYKSTKEPYAMKRIPNDKQKQNNIEVKYHMGLKCPTVIELIEHKELDDYIYMIMEYAEHGTLSTFLEKHIEYRKKEIEYKPNVDRILDWMVQLFLGLFTIHDKKLIHRDIKSDNLFLDKNDILKIGDLGIAKAIEKGANTICGTFHYMAPEIHQFVQYDSKVDIWAAGVVLYELVMLDRPFEGRSDEIIQKVLSMDFKPFPKDVDPDLACLLEHTLKFKKDERSSAKDILNLKFMLNRLQRMSEEKTIKIDEEILLKIQVDAEDFIDHDTEEMKKKLKQTKEERDLMEQFYKDFSNCIQLDSSVIKTSFQKSYFSVKYDNVVKGSDLEMCASEIKLKKKDIERLISKGYILNISNPNEEEFLDDDSNFYMIKLLEDPAIDNSFISIDIESKKKSNPLEISRDCLTLAETLLGKLNLDNENNKQEILKSNQFFEFLHKIKQIKNFDFSVMKRKEKLCIILNIYQTMFIHHLLKSELFPEGVSAGGGFFDSVKSLVQNSSKTVQVVYQIGEHKMSLYDLKHIVIRRNRKPFDAYMRLASGGDARINLIEEPENNKFLPICMDPPASYEDLNYDLHFTKFSVDNLTEEIDNHIKKFVEMNVFLEDTELKIPRNFKDYLKDFNSSESDLIKFLLKTTEDPELKPNLIVKALSSKEITINFY